MTKFKTKVILVDAIQFEGGNYDDVTDFILEKATEPGIQVTPMEPEGTIIIAQPNEGREVVITKGDWVVVHNGDLDFVARDAFMDTYESAEGCVFWRDGKRYLLGDDGIEYELMVLAPNLEREWLAKNAPEGLVRIDTKKEQ